MILDFGMRSLDLGYSARCAPLSERSNLLPDKAQRYRQSKL